MSIVTRRLVGIVLGLAAIPIGLLAATFGFIVGILVVGEPLWALGLFVWVILTIVSWHLFEGRKHVILFLRKFGPSEASEFLRQCLSLGSSRYRLVTLDDLSFRPRFAEGSYVVITFVMIIPLLLLALLLLAISIPETGATPGGSGRINLLILCAAIGPVLTSVIRLLVFQRRLSRLTVAFDSDLTKAVKLVKSLQGWDMAPQANAAQMTTVSVGNMLWQATVVSIAREASIIVVDLSTLTDNLVWELDYTRSEHRKKLIITCRSSTLPVLLGRHGAIVQAGDIDVKDIFAYGSPSENVQRRSDASALVKRFDMCGR